MFNWKFIPGGMQDQSRSEDFAQQNQASVGAATEGSWHQK